MKILITGSEGFLGKKLISILSNRFDVIGIDKENDITKNKIITTIKKIKPDIIVHAAAYTNVDDCEKNKGLAYKINVEGTRNIIESAKLTESKIIYISTDFIFDGKKGNYKEDDLPNPINYYSKTKFEGEELVKKYHNSLIIRTAVLYGCNDENDSSNFVKWVIKSLKNNKRIIVVTDQTNSPTLIDDIGYAIIRLINQVGIFHVAGSEAISRYDFALKISAIFNLNKNLIEPITSEKLNQIALRPKDVSLDISKIKSLGLNMLDINKGLLKINERIKYVV